jgi:anti-sigma factor RsiW
MRRPPEPPAAARRLPPDCERALARLDAWADGELGPAALAGLERHAAACPACAEELELARELARELPRLPRHNCPPAVCRAVLATAAAEARARVREARGQGSRPVRPARRWLSWPPGSRARRLSLRPILAGALVAVLAAGGALLWPRRPAPARPSASELARAELELKLAFAYLGRVGREAGVRVRDEMVANVLAPTERALGAPDAARPRP